MKVEEIDWEKVDDIASRTGEEDEYSSLTWGSKWDIEYICECLEAFKKQKELDDINNPLIETELKLELLQKGSEKNKLQDKLDRILEIINEEI